MPVLFTDKQGAAAYTTNNVNSLLDKEDVFTADTRSPVVDYGTGARPILDDYVIKVYGLAGYGTERVHVVDDLAYHDDDGSLHCATNAQRVIPEAKWWA